jgi:hypothetical protein
VRFVISEDFVLDYGDFREEGMRVAILARSGGGKSNLAAVLVEEALSQGVQVCVIEPIEEWFTLRSAYDSVVWVGEEGDLPLVPEAAHTYTKLLEDGASLVMTVATGDEYRDKDFVASFLWSLYSRWRRVRRPIYLVLEEADAYAPQMWTSQDRLCLSRVATVAKRGRKLGINPVFLSQRPADIHKSVISQSNVLFMGGFNTTQDLEAVRQLSKLLHLEIPTDEVARLGPGEFFAIVHGEVFRLRARLRKTPHGGVTPELQRPVRPDLQRSLSGLREALEREMERAREEQDALRRLMRENEELRRRVQEYEEQLRTLKIVKEVPIELRVAHEGAAPAQAATDTVPEVVYRCRYPGAVKVYQYLASAGDFVKLKDVANATGLSVANVKRIVRYFKKRGLVRAKTVSMCGREVIRMVRLR